MINNGKKRGRRKKSILHIEIPEILQTFLSLIFLIEHILQADRPT